MFVYVNANVQYLRLVCSSRVRISYCFAPFQRQFLRRTRAKALLEIQSASRLITEIWSQDICAHQPANTLWKENCTVLNGYYMYRRK